MYLRYSCKRKKNYKNRDGYNLSFNVCHLKLWLENLKVLDCHFWKFYNILSPLSDWMDMFISVPQILRIEVIDRNFIVLMPSKNRYGKNSRPIVVMRHYTFKLTFDVQWYIRLHRSHIISQPDTCFLFCLYDSAGIGRTGTFIALDYLIQQAKETNCIDVVECVETLRRQRINMVQTMVCVSYIVYQIETD